MSTKLNIAKDARKAFQQAVIAYREAVLAKNAVTGEIEACFIDKLNVAKESIDIAIAKIDVVTKMLEKDSDKHIEYKKMSTELKKWKELIEKVR